MPGKKRRRNKFWSMHGTFNGIKFESGHERSFLSICRQLGIKVARCKDKVPYKDADGKWHTYSPDFVWPELGYVIEIKGRWAFRDNHGNVREKFFAATKHYSGRFTMLTEKELTSDFIVTLYKSLLGSKSGN